MLCYLFFSSGLCVLIQAWSWRCEGTEAGTDNSACPLGGDNRETGEAVVPCDLRKDKSRDRSGRVGAHQSVKTAVMLHHTYSSALPVLIGEVFTNWCYWANRLTYVRMYQCRWSHVICLDSGKDVFHIYANCSVTPSMLRMQPTRCPAVSWS